MRSQCQLSTEPSVLQAEQITLAAPQKSCPQGPSPSWSSLSRYTLIVRCPYIEVPKNAHSAQGRATRVNVEWDSSLPRPAGYAVLDAHQDTAVRFDCQGTLLT